MFEIYSVLNLVWVGKATVFIIAAIISFFIPGIVLSNWIGWKEDRRYLLAWILGISFWSLQAYVFGWFQLRWLTYFYLIGCLVLAWKQKQLWWPITYRIRSTALQKILLIAGTILLLVPVVGSGWRTERGISYYWINGFDGLFHLSLSRSLVESVPPLQPGASGLVVQNYHYLSNLVIADMARVWNLPINHLYFQFFPFLVAILLGLVVYELLKTWSAKKSGITIGLLIFYLAAEISWLLSVLLQTDTELIFNNYIDSQLIQFLNPPQAFAKLVFFASLLMLRDFWTKKSFKKALILGPLIGSMVGTKVYFALFLGLGLAMVYGIELLKMGYVVVKRKETFGSIFRNYRYDAVLGLTIIATFAVLYIPNNSQAGGIFPAFLFWPKLLLGQGKIFWNEWWLRLQVYEAANNTRALVVWYSMAIAIFLTAIYHLRLLGLLVVLKWFRAKLMVKEILLLTIPSIVLTMVAMNFLQVSGGGNIFNFFVVAITSLTLFSAVVLGEIWEKLPLVRILIIAGIVLMAVQPMYNTWRYIRNYYLGYDVVTISNKHEELLKYLSSSDSISSSKDALLQTHPDAFLDYNTPYWYFFTGRRAFYSGRGILNDHNQNVVDKKEVEKSIFSHPHAASISAQIAEEERIQYLILQKSRSKEMEFLTRSALATYSGTFSWKKDFENSDWIVLQPVPMN